MCRWVSGLNRLTVNQLPNGDGGSNPSRHTILKVNVEYLGVTVA